jgi:hypothetical protein
MDKEEIKNELIARCEKISQSIKDNMPRSSGMFGALKDVAERTMTLREFGKDKIVDELNRILEEKNISFKDNEKSELIKYLKPYISELLKRHIGK